MNPFRLVRVDCEVHAKLKRLAGDQATTWPWSLRDPTDGSHVVMVERDLYRHLWLISLALGVRGDINVAMRYGLGLPPPRYSRRN